MQSYSEIIGSLRRPPVVVPQRVVDKYLDVVQTIKNKGSEYKLGNSGTSEGVEKAWQERIRKGEVSHEYAAALDKSRAAVKEYHEACLAYRSKKIGDEEYLKARKKHKDAEKEFDDAYSKEESRKLGNKADEKLVGNSVQFAGEKVANAAHFAPAQDGWIHITPLGEFKHPSKLIQQIDKESIEAMVKNFNQAKEKNPKHLIHMDFDHRGSSAEDTTASGWLSNLEARDDGLWGKVNWSDVGESAVKGGRFLYLSPVWKRSECENLTENKIRPLVLDSCALTNEPNIRGAEPIARLVY